ncbi:HlyD family efflux transporter periplasmic adaptor subunit [Pirellulaceae bacterium SH501]
MSSKNPLVRLRPEVSFNCVSTRQGTRYVAEDLSQDKFWRLGPLEYELCALLDGQLRLQEAVALGRRHSEVIGSHDPSKVQKTLVWLMQAGILERLDGDSPVESLEAAPASPPPKLFDPSFFRIPVLSTEQLERITKPLTWLLSVPVACIALLLWGIGISFAITDFHTLTSLSTELFVPGSQWWLLLAWVVLKTVHELGHAIACTRVGAKPRSAGIGFMFFAPSPYVNVTSVWRIDNRWSRILVSASGMLFELTVAAIAAIGVCTLESSSLRFFCASIVTLGTFSTLVFNGNPLMRFDGYYILIDLIGRPNLWQDAQAAVKQILKRALFRSEQSTPIAPMLLFYGFTSWVSRMLTLVTMGWGLWVAWDGIGVIVVIAFALLWFVVPRFTSKQQAFLGSVLTGFWETIQALDPKKCRRAAAVASAIGLLGFLPSPLQIYWPGCIDFVEPSELRVDAPGFVREVLVHDGQGVRAGDEILRMENPALQIEYEIAVNMKESSEHRCQMLCAQRKESELQAEEALLDALRYQCTSLKQKLDSLIVKAPRAGVLMIRASQNLAGAYLEAGNSIGLVVDPAQLEVRASVPQDAWERMADAAGQPVVVRLSNGEKWQGSVLQVLPRSSDVLSYASLGGVFGGPIAVKPDKDEQGKEQYKTEEPRLEVRVALKPKSITSSAWNTSMARSLPPAGIHCSLRMELESESGWSAIWRWVDAALQFQFRTDARA